ncbi:hypothetical protein Tco_1235749 [Tanacetum coccineum]
MSNQLDDIHAAGSDTQLADNTQHDTSLSTANALLENLTKQVALLAQQYKTQFPQTNNQLRTSSNTHNQATLQNGRVVVQNVQGRQNRVQGNNARGVVAAGNGGAQYRAGNANVGQGKPIKCYNCNGIGHDNVVDEDVDEPLVQDLALNMNNVFQADDCDAFVFMANLSSADPVYDEVSLSYDSDILSEVPDHDNYQDVVCEHHDVYEIHDDVQPNYVVDSHADYTSDSNMILYDQYVKDNAATQCVSANEQNKVINASLTAELTRCKEQVELYERWAKFELKEREQKINEQLRIVITDHNIKEENLKKELHSVKTAT